MFRVGDQVRVLKERRDVRHENYPEGRVLTVTKINDASGGLLPYDLDYPHFYFLEDELELVFRPDRWGFVCQEVFG